MSSQDQRKAAIEIAVLMLHDPRLAGTGATGAQRFRVLVEVFAETLLNIGKMAKFDLRKLLEAMEDTA